MNTYQNEKLKQGIFRIQNIIRKISPEDKKIFLITFFAILFAHGFRLANYLPNHDTLWNFYGPQDVITSGRWSIVWATGISSNYDLQWLNGVISILYIAMTNLIIIRVFHIKNILLGCSFGVLLGVYPSVVSTFMYMYTADAYYLAMFLSAAAAVLILSSDWKRRLAGSVLLSFSMGIYQAYLSVTLVLCVLWLIKSLIIEGKSIKVPFFNILYSTLMGGGIYTGMLYYRLDGRKLSSYKGINESTLIHSVSWYFKTWKSCYPEIKDLIVQQDTYNNPIIANMIWILWLIVLSVLCILLFALIRKKQPVRVLQIIIMLVSLPVLIYCLKFLTEKLVYNGLMVHSAALLWLIPICLLDHMIAWPKLRMLAEIMLAIIAVYIGNLIVGANISYLSAYTSYEKSYALCIRIADRMEQLEGWRNAKSLLITGSPDNEKYEGTMFTKVVNDRVGIPNGIIPNRDIIYVRMINYYLGGNYVIDWENNNTVKTSDTFAEMGVWPETGSVEIIDDVIVVKMSEEDE